MKSLFYQTCNLRYYAKFILSWTVFYLSCYLCLIGMFDTIFASIFLDTSKGSINFLKKLLPKYLTIIKNVGWFFNFDDDFKTPIIYLMRASQGTTCWMLKVVINHGHHIVNVGQPILDNQHFFKIPSSGMSIRWKINCIFYQKRIYSIG